MEYDIHTILDLATLGTTLWVIFMIRFKLRASFMEDKDNFALYYVVTTSVSFFFFSNKIFSCQLLKLFLFLFLKKIGCSLCRVLC